MGTEGQNGAEKNRLKDFNLESEIMVETIINPLKQ